MTELIHFLHDRRNSNLLYAETLKAMAPLLPVDTGNLLVEVADRMEREAEAQKRIVAEHAPIGLTCRTCCGEGVLEVHWDGEEETTEEIRNDLMAPCPTVRLLAVPYADHPDYRDDWRPDEA